MLLKRSRQPDKMHIIESNRFSMANKFTRNIYAWLWLKPYNEKIECQQFRCQQNEWKEIEPKNTTAVFRLTMEYQYDTNNENIPSTRSRSRNVWLLFSSLYKFCVLIKLQLYHYPSILKHLKQPVIVFRFVKCYFKPDNVSVSSHFFYDIIHFSVLTPYSYDKKSTCVNNVVGCRFWCFQLFFAQSSVSTLLSLNYILYENCILLKLFKHIRMMTIQ